MQFPEVEASGMAKIKSIEPCPPIAEGTGNVVTARIVTRQVSDLVELTIEGGDTLTGTPQHPIWSIERQDWVELGDLEIGEHLWTEDGPVEVQSTRLLSTAESVYNLEVHGHHIYQVGDVGVLVHNANPICRVKTPNPKKAPIPKSRTGKGTTPKNLRDKKSVWSQMEKLREFRKRACKCDQCVKKVPFSKIKGHHLKR